MKKIKLVFKTNVSRELGEYFASKHKRGKRTWILDSEIQLLSRSARISFKQNSVASRQYSISSPIRMHQCCSPRTWTHMKSSRWEKYCTCPPRSMWRRATGDCASLIPFLYCERSELNNAVDASRRKRFCIEEQKLWTPSFRTYGGEIYAYVYM